MIAVSVIVPIYNVEIYLEECLDSILAQTLCNIEVICINDGSTDKSPDILKRYELKDSRIKVVNKVNTGYGHSMNIGLDMASGEYIAIVESDDYIKDNAFETMYNYGKKYELDIVGSNFYQVYANGNLDILEEYVVCDGDKCNKINPYEEDIYTNIVNNQGRIWTRIYRAEFIRCNNIRFHESQGASYQDAGFAFFTTMLSNRIKYIEEAFYCYRIDNPNSSMKSLEKTKALCKEYDYVLRELDRRNIKDDIYYKVAVDVCIRDYMIGHVYRIDSEYIPQMIECLKDFITRNQKWIKYNNECVLIPYKKMIDMLMNDTDRFYENIQLIKSNRIKRTTEIETFLKANKNIVIYGAGIWGKMVCRTILSAKMVDKVDCFVVTQKCDNQDLLNGMPVVAVDRLEYIKSDTAVIVAVKGDTAKVMYEYAKKLGFENVLIWEKEIKWEDDMVL